MKNWEQALILIEGRQDPGRAFSSILKKTLLSWKKDEPADKKIQQALEAVASELDGTMWDPQFLKVLTPAWVDFLKVVGKGYNEE